MANNKPKPSKTVSQRAGRNVQKKQGGMFGAVGGYKGVNKGMVRQLINQTVRPELMAMRGDRRYVNRQADRAIGDANSLYDRSVGDLNYVFGEAGDYISNLGQQVNAGYDQTGQRMAGFDQAGQSAMQANTSAVQQAINAQLQGLGISQQAGVDPTLQQDAAFAQNQAIQQAANNQTNNAAAQQSANTLTSLLGGMIAGSKASNLGLASQTRQTGINDINRAKQDDLSTVNESMQQLRASKPGMIREMLLQLQAQGFDQWQALQQLNLSRQQMRLGMQEDSAYYGTGAQAWGAQSGSLPGSSTSSGTSSNPSWTPNAGRPTKPGKKPGRKPGRSSSHVSGSQADAIYGPLAGGY